MASTHDVAHINVQGQDVILVMVQSSVGSMGSSRQREVLAYIQGCANHAGLAGAVALIWQNGDRIDSFGPARWNGYLRGLTAHYVAANINGTLTCS